MGGHPLRLRNTDLHLYFVLASAQIGMLSFFHILPTLTSVLPLVHITWETLYLGFREYSGYTGTIPNFQIVVK